VVTASISKLNTMPQNRKHKSQLKKSRWHLLFVSDDGRTVPVRHFMGIVWTVILGAGILLTVIGVLLFRYNGLLDAKKGLENALASQAREVTDARKKADHLLAQLAIAESKLKISQAATAVSAPETEAVPQETAPEKSDLKAPQTARISADSGLPEDEENTVLENSTAEPALVSVDNLLVCYNPEDGRMVVEFKIINTGEKKQPVSGHAFCVLKDGKERTGGWLVYPATKLVNGIPAQTKGMRFRIYNFRTMKFAVNHDDPNSFVHASIFVYQQDTGTLLVERDFEITGIPTCP
jgi:hypothetical protein